MIKISVFEPAMCCSSGVCGADVDKKLVDFAATLNGLNQENYSVERFNLSQNPDAFTANHDVAKMLKEKGVDCLPIILADEKIVHSGSYPSLEEFKTILNIQEINPIHGSEEKTQGCSEGCACLAQEPSSSTRWLVTSVITIIVALLVFRAVNKSDAMESTAEKGFQISQLTQPKNPQEVSGEDNKTATPSSQVSEAAIQYHTLKSMNELNTAAASVNAVFVIIAEADSAKYPEIDTSLGKVVKALDGFGIKAGAFKLAQVSEDFSNIAKQVPLPSVLALVKGGGMVVLSKDFNESNLMQAFVAASRSGGGCGSGGCGTSGGSAGCN